MRRLARTFASGALCALCAAVLSVGATFIVDRAYAALGLEIPVPDWVAKLLDPDAARAELACRAATLAFGALAVAPVCEEFIFRGLLQGFLEKKTGRTVLPVALTAVAFAAIHASAYSFLPLLAVSACFSAARIKSGGLAAPIVAHSLYNALAIGATLAVRAA